MKKLFLAVAVLLTLCFAQAAMAQTSTSASTFIYAVKGESLSISASTIPNLVLNAAGTDSQADQNLTITTNWNLIPTRSTLAVCAAVTSPTLAASDPSNTDSIPVTAVYASTSSTFAAINGAAGCGQSAVTTVNSYALGTVGRKNISKTDTLKLRLTGVPATIQADTYKGTITVYAYVTP